MAKRKAKEATITRRLCCPRCSMPMNRVQEKDGPHWACDCGVLVPRKEGEDV